jgi:hypothetical protein
LMFHFLLRCALQVGYSSPTQLGIMRDLHLSLAEVPTADRAHSWVSHDELC